MSPYNASLGLGELRECQYCKFEKTVTSRTLLCAAVAFCAWFVRWKRWCRTNETYITGRSQDLLISGWRYVATSGASIMIVVGTNCRFWRKVYAFFKFQWNASWDTLNSGMFDGNASILEVSWNWLPKFVKGWTCECRFQRVATCLELVLFDTLGLSQLNVSAMRARKMLIRMFSCRCKWLNARTPLLDPVRQKFQLVERNVCNSLICVLLILCISFVVQWSNSD